MIASMSDAIFDHELIESLFQYEISITSQLTFVKLPVGTELLPTEGGYMMYPNHQGKYDALGIIYTHREPCSLVMDKAKSNTILVREFVDLLQGKRLEKKDVRQALTIINEVSEEVKQGKRYILFPEGGYEFNNKNHVCDFKAGSFKIALKTKAPIVPVALIDSYKVFNSFCLGPVNHAGTLSETDLIR